MSLFGRLFGKKRDDGPMRDVRALAAPLAVPAVQVVLRSEPSRSHFGGDPALPGGVPWPEKDGARLAFLARLSLLEIHSALRVPWLPETGALLFFYDVENLPWGFDPTDRGGWAVVLVPDLPEQVAQAERGPSDPGPPFPQTNVAFRRIEVFPSWERPSVSALGLNDRESDEFERIASSAFGGSSNHQVTGFPAPVQADDMEAECQLASHGVYRGDTSWRSDARSAELLSGTADWRLLLQVDSDDALGWMWGDLGLLYFWVQESAARRGDFSNVWLVLQCA